MGTKGTHKMQWMVGLAVSRNILTDECIVMKDRQRNKMGEGSFAKVYRGEYNSEPRAVKVFKEDVLTKETSPNPETSLI